MPSKPPPRTHAPGETWQVHLEADTIRRLRAIANRLGAVSSARVASAIVTKYLDAAEADPAALLVLDAAPSEPR